VRLMDLDPFVPVGITAQTMRFLDVFLLHCLLCDSPPDNRQELAAIARNQHRVAARGREPGLRLERDARQVELFEWGGQVLVECQPIAEALDAAHGASAYREALAVAEAALTDASLVPSARVLAAMERNHGNAYVRFVLMQSLLHKATLQTLPFAPETEERYRRMAEDSLEEQRRIEAADDIDFETYRQRYMSHGLLGA
jgi:glutamate--cysteine ligase